MPLTLLGVSSVDPQPSSHSVPNRSVEKPNVRFDRYDRSLAQGYQPQQRYPLSVHLHP
ncbi:Uncharacterised protein [Vibrio cholerae]|nr:Uncharacterised protein [Vibrio cholerae]